MGETDSWGRASCLDRLVRYNDLRTVLELIEAAGGDDVARIDAFDGRHAGVRSSWLDGLHSCSVVPDHVDEGLLSVVLNGIRGNQRDALQRFDQKPRVHE